VAISNERSSNEGNTWYCDQEINHQYSKTYEFERDLQAYVQNYLPKNAPFYFSFMRPLYELQIAQIFAQFTDYHQVFRSCNRGQKQNAWCTECSKCLFAWTILFPFFDHDELTNYFGRNLFDNENLWQTAQELLGLSNTKPFDCVGTHEESAIAFYLCIKHYQKNDRPLPTLLEKVDHELKTNPKLQNGPDGQSDYENRAKSLLSAWNLENSLPSEFAHILKNELEKAAKS
jgi:UDP-N-acetyl-alpha-D-muramoyl-L-alanyl-L-glutamate epimerase